MNWIYKSHGKHCALRSFPTKCPRCEASVLYWECTHGSKLFFNYPIYGKLIRHSCQLYVSKNKKNKYPIIVKTPNKILTENGPSCSICGKYFKTTIDLDSHMKEIKKFDPLHKQFVENKLIFRSNSSEEVFSNKSENKSFFKPKFGRINIKKRNDT